jgi:hypothetical protein
LATAITGSLDFHVWRYLKDIVYERNVGTRADLIRRTVDASDRANLRHVTRSLVRWEECVCIEAEGRHSERLLQRETNAYVTACTTVK